MKKQLLIPIFLAALTLPACLNKGLSANNAEFIGEYGQNDKAKYIEHASKVQDTLAEEGFVLLKNKDNFLPMQGQGKKITLAGKSSPNLARGGAGSGSGSVSSGVDDYQLVGGADGHVKGALEEAGFDVNKTLCEFYGTWKWSNNRA